jgi:hypothetical protein
VEVLAERSSVEWGSGLPLEVGMGGKLGIPVLLIVVLVPAVMIWVFGFVSGIAYAKRDKKQRATSV